MIRLVKPTVKRKDMDAVLNTMVDEAIGPGKQADMLVEQLCQYLGAEDGFATRSYVQAVHVCCNILQLQTGSTVVLSPLAPGFYIQVLKSRGIEIVFSDVDPFTGCMLPDRIHEVIDVHAPSAIFFYHPAGNLPDYSALSSVNIPCVEDISQSLGSKRGLERPGKIAALSILSLEEDGIISAGGGAVVLAHDRKHVKTLQASREEYGTLEILPDLNASLAINQLQSLDRFIERRREYLALFRNAVMKTKHTVLVENSETFESNAYSLPVLLESRYKEVLRYTKRFRIETGNPYERCAITVVPSGDDLCPNSIPFRMRVVQFPLYPMLSQDQLKTLVRVLSTLP